MHKSFFASLLLIALTVPVYGVQDKPDQSEAYYHFILGALKERSRDYSAAIEEYREALQYDPKASDIFARLSDLYIQTNRLQDAMKDAQKAIEQNADNKEAHRMLGQVYMEKAYENPYNQEAVQTAIREFQEVLRIDPEDESALLSLSQLRLQNNQPQQAIDLLLQYLEKNPDSQMAIMSLVSAYQQMNQPEKAISYLLKYSEMNPDNYSITQQIADSYLKMGDSARALEFQRRVFESDPGNPTVLRKYVDLLGKTQNYREAIEILNEMAKADPQKLEWLILLARTYQMSGNQEQAETTIKKRMETNPDDLDLELALVQIYEGGNKFQDAIRQLQSMVQAVQADKTLEEKDRNANLALLYSHMGFSAYQLKDYDRSIELYKKARELTDPENAYKLDFYIALNYRAQKNWDKTIEILNSIIKQDANDKESWEMLSLVYEEKGDLENSDRIVQHLIDTHPKQPRYYLLKAEKLQRREKYEESIDFLKQLRSKFPSNDQIPFLLGAGSERLKKYNDAEEYFKQTIALNPENADALNYLGYMLIDSGMRIEESIEYIKRALEIDHDNGAYLDSLGWGYFKLNKLDLAEDNLRQALEQMKDNAVVNDHVGDLYFKLGRFREAIGLWENAIRNKTNDIDPQYIQKKIDDTKRRLP